VDRRILKQELTIMLRHTKQRRTAGAVLVILGALLMWLAPGPTFTSQAATGLVLLLAGVVLELIGIALEHRDRRRS
jgi:drug/metabolite transporter (DMT)-like permease